MHAVVEAPFAIENRGQCLIAPDGSTTRSACRQVPRGIFDLSIGPVREWHKIFGFLRLKSHRAAAQEFDPSRKRPTIPRNQRQHFDFRRPMQAIQQRFEDFLDRRELIYARRGINAACRCRSRRRHRGRHNHSNRERQPERCGIGARVVVQARRTSAHATAAQGIRYRASSTKSLPKQLRWAVARAYRASATIRMALPFDLGPA